MTSLFLNIDFGTVGGVDNGSRPYTGSTPLWNNASIFMDGGPSQTETNVGTPTTVRVRVSNSSQAAVEDVTVDAYVMSPFVGLTNPALAVRRLRGFSASIAPGSGNSSGNDPHIVVCKIQDPVQGPIPWTPTNDDLATTQSGHLCLVANAYADGDGASIPDGGSFDVVNDPHQGQRNIHLLASAGAKPFRFHIMGTPDGRETALDFRQLTSAVLQNGGERWLLRSRANVGVPIHSGNDKRLWLTGRPGSPSVPLSFSRKAIRGTIQVDGFGESDLTKLAAATKRMIREGRTFVARQGDWGADRLVMRVPDGGVRATLNLTRSDQPGSVQVFDIVQRDQNGRVLGGQRIISLQR